MPRYDYVCEDGHVTEQQGGYDDTEIACPVGGAEVLGFPGAVTVFDLSPTGTIKRGATPPICGKIARRQAVYRSQGVIFKGSGFTRSVIVPDPPRPTSTAELTTDQRMEVLDEFAKDTHKYDENVLPYKKKEDHRRL